MVAPLVLIGGGMVAGAMALWAVIRQALDLSKPIRTRKGNGVRILTSQRVSSDGCPIVAAVSCGGDMGEVISIYTKRGVFGGTLWSKDEHCAGALQEMDKRDLSDLINTSEPGPAPLSPAPGAAVYPASRPLDLSRTIRTRMGNRAQILATDLAGQGESRIVALVHLQWLDADPLEGAEVELKARRTGVIRGTTVMEQVINVYSKYGDFLGTVVSEAEAELGAEYLKSFKFDLRRDMTDLCYCVTSPNESEQSIREG